MLLRPLALAVLAAALTGTLLLGAALPHAWRVLRRWNPADAGEAQVRLERDTWLFPPLAAFALALQTLALPLFLLDADRAAALLPGAMCAVGTLRASALGFPALFTHLALVLLGSVWLALHRIDARTPGAPLARPLAALLGVLAPLQAAVLGLQAAFYADLDPARVTSCCQTLFDPATGTAAGGLAAWAPGRALPAFIGALLLAAALAFACLRKPALGLWAALAGLAAAAVACAGITSFLGPYVYELPGHHCPFCLLQPEYARVGWLLYPPLLGATAAALALGALHPLRGRFQAAPAAAATARRLAWTAGLGFLAFLVLSLVLIGRSRLILR